MKVFVIPGLGDNSKRTKKYIKEWSGSKLKVEIHEFNWSDREKGYDEKFKDLLVRFDSVAEQDSPIVVVGISAGASVAINLLQHRSRDVSKVICICGRLQRGGISLLRPWWLYKLTHPDFIESVKTCEQGLTQIPENKVLTVSSRLDEVVPLATTRLQGAREILVNYPAHSLAIKQIFKKVLPKLLG